MTVTIELSPEIEAGILAQAEAEGLLVGECLHCSEGKCQRERMKVKPTSCRRKNGSGSSRRG
jgi:hypothetical protein